MFELHCENLSLRPWNNGFRKGILDAWNGENDGSTSQRERNLKADNITVERLQCPFPGNVFSIIEEQTKELDRNQVVQFPIPSFLSIYQREYIVPDW